MRTGRPKKPLEIAAEDREKLNMIARRPKSAQAMAMRARIVLGCEQGLNNSEVARKVHVTGATVGKWRERFREFGLDRLLDEPRSARLAKSPTKRSKRSLPKRWKQCRPTAPTGAPASWPRRWGYRKTPSCGSGVLSDCSRIEWRTSNSPKTRNLWRRCGTSWPCT